MSENSAGNQFLVDGAKLKSPEFQNEVKEALVTFLEQAFRGFYYPGGTFLVLRIYPNGDIKAGAEIGSANPSCEVYHKIPRSLTIACRRSEPPPDADVVDEWEEDEQGMYFGSEETLKWDYYECLNETEIAEAKAKGWKRFRLVFDISEEILEMECPDWKDRLQKWVRAHTGDELDQAEGQGAYETA